MYSRIKISFKRELFVSFILVALLPLAISSIFFVRFFESRVTKDYEKEAVSQMQSVESTFTQFLTAAEAAEKELVKNEVILKGIRQNDSWETNKAYTKLYEKTQKYRSYADFSIYDAEGNCLLSTASMEETESLPVYWGILKVAKTHPEETIIRNAYLRKAGEENYLQIARAFYENEECIGFLVMEMNEKHFDALFQNIYDERNRIVILNRFWEEIYSTQAAKEDSLAQTLRTRRMAGEEIKQNTDEMNFFISDLGDTDLYLVIGKEAVFTDDIKRTMFGVTISIALLSMVLCLSVATIMSAYLTSPIEKLTLAMHKAENGDLDVHVESQRKDELGRLSANFNKMTHELKEYMELQVRQQKELNDSNTAMMQAQLNPHFLYNTLDTMKWVAKANHVPEIATLSASLAKILRMSISEEKFVTLEKEIELVRYYTDIQKIRFNGSFSVDIELPIELEDCIVPKLIIQPIVENAIIHGLKEQDHGHVFLNIYEADSTLLIEVSDDGCGMDEEMIRLLNSRDQEKLKGHIGFYNVDTIIRLYYGDEYGLEADKLKEGGTRITIRLPLAYEEKSNA